MSGEPRFYDETILRGNILYIPRRYLAILYDLYMYTRTCCSVNKGTELHVDTVLYKIV